MIRGVAFIAAGIFLLASAVGCSKKTASEQVIIQIPSGFNGDFMLEMGVKDAPALDKVGNQYFIEVPRSGKLTTSTLITRPQVSFKNAGDGSVWGFSQNVFSTGDGIPVGGKIEFFVGTKKDFDAEEQRKNHSGGFEPTELWADAKA